MVPPHVLEERSPAQGQDVPATTPDLALRRTLVWIQKTLLDLDRLEDGDGVARRLWDLASGLGLRTMMLHEKGTTLHADAAEGFAAFEGERQTRLRQVVVPYEPQGLFAVTASDKAVYSGPRPSRGLPVDLVLTMGKEPPAWCLVIPLPSRHRWGRFLYVDAAADRLEDILRLDPVARLAVQQLRAARVQPHRPALRVRALQEAALRQCVERGAPADAAEATPPEPPPAGIDRFTRKGRRAVSPLTAPAPERFDARGELIRPLPPSEIESRVGSLPDLPTTAGLVLTLLDDPETTVSALEEVIGGDAELVERFLHIANSSQFGALKECQSVSDAIVRLGFTAIRSWLLATTTRKLFLPEDASPSQRAIWQHSVAAAVAAQRLAEETKVTDPETGFLGGLLQNVGLLLMARDHREVLEEILAQAADSGRPGHEVERRRLGFDHADLSALLLARWALPEDVVEAVRTHHRLDEAGPHQSLAAVIALAEALAQHAAAQEPPGALLESREAALLGLEPRDVTALARRLEPMMLDRGLVS